MQSDHEILFEKILELALKDKLVLWAGVEVPSEFLICRDSSISSEYSINQNHNGN
jgi:hypothetical protein